MIELINFSIAFFFSFIGTIPPGTINLTVLQLGLDNKINLAWRLAIAASLVEYPYAWLAVKFERAITSTPVILENIQLITAVVMTSVGLFTVWSARQPSKFSEKFHNSGFRRGVMLGLLNPLALPFWMGTIAYLNGQHWIDLSSTLGLHSFLLGVSAGGFTIFMILAYLAKKVASKFQTSVWLKKIPGFVLLFLGLYAFIQYLIK